MQAPKHPIQKNQSGSRYFLLIWFVFLLPLEGQVLVRERAGLQPALHPVECLARGGIWGMVFNFLTDE